ncbi:hypothetical protein HDV00_000957 [Rhizophlyctis rosea]|nr:hypothetical protein HDV00_000957 [Rhizophlyctis rosea]
MDGYEDGALPWKNLVEHEDAPREMDEHGAAWPFLQPFDPVAAGAPDYFDIIEHPMDLSTIETKLSSRQYETVQGFAADIKLMLDNCSTYLPSTHNVHQLAKNLREYVSMQLTKMFPAMELAMSGGDAAPAFLGRRKRDIKPPRVFEPEAVTVEDASSDEEEMYESKISTPKAGIGEIHAQLPNLRPKRKVPSTMLLTPPAFRGRNISDAMSANTPSGGGTPSTSQTSRSTVENRTPIYHQSPYRTSRPTVDLASPFMLGNSLPPTPTTPGNGQTSRKRTSEQITKATYTSIAAAAGATKECEYCGASVTPMWRRGPAGKSTLCNKCGLQWRKGKIPVDENGRLALPPFASETAPKRGTGATKKQAGGRKAKAKDGAQRPIRQKIEGKVSAKKILAVGALARMNSKGMSSTSLLGGESSTSHGSNEDQAAQPPTEQEMTGIQKAEVKAIRDPNRDAKGKSVPLITERGKGRIQYGDEQPECQQEERKQKASRKRRFADEETELSTEFLKKQIEDTSDITEEQRFVPASRKLQKLMDIRKQGAAYFFSVDRLDVPKQFRHLLEFRPRRRHRQRAQEAPEQEGPAPMRKAVEVEEGDAEQEEPALKRKAVEVEEGDAEQEQPASKRKAAEVEEMRESEDFIDEAGPSGLNFDEESHAAGDLALPESFDTTGEPLEARGKGKERAGETCPPSLLKRCWNMVKSFWEGHEEEEDQEVQLCKRRKVGTRAFSEEEVLAKPLEQQDHNGCSQPAVLAGSSFTKAKEREMLAKKIRERERLQEAYRFLRSRRHRWQSKAEYCKRMSGVDDLESMYELEYCGVREKQLVEEIAMVEDEIAQVKSAMGVGADEGGEELDDIIQPRIRNLCPPKPSGERKDSADLRREIAVDVIRDKRRRLGGMLAALPARKQIWAKAVMSDMAGGDIQPDQISFNKIYRNNETSVWKYAAVEEMYDFVAAVGGGQRVGAV